MLLRIWSLMTLLLVALLLGTSFTHTLEMSAKLQYGAVQWDWLQQTLYRAFASVGGPIELGAILTSAVLAFLLRRRRTSFLLSAAGTGCLIIAFGIWVFITHAVNVETARWTAATIPTNWAQWRTQWEYSHVVRFIFHLLGFTALAGALSPREG